MVVGKILTILEYSYIDVNKMHKEHHFLDSHSTINRIKETHVGLVYFPPWRDHMRDEESAKAKNK